jgi:hypothetical protein
MEGEVCGELKMIFFISTSLTMPYNILISYILFICYLFKDVYSVTDCVALNERVIMKMKWEGSFKVISWHSFGVTEENHENLSQVSHSPDRYMKPGSPEY